MRKKDPDPLPLAASPFFLIIINRKTQTFEAISTCSPEGLCVASLLPSLSPGPDPFQ